MAYERVKEGELQVGEPVPWALYDAEERLLLARGVVIESDRQVQELMSRGLFRRLKLASPLAAAQQGQAPHEQPREELKGFEDIKLAVGDSFQLQGQSGSVTVRYYVKLIGYLRGKGIIVTTPTQDGKVLLMREGQSFIVRMFSGKSVYAFPTSVFKVANVPYPHLHLTYPSQVKGLVVRRGARVKVHLIAAAQDARGQTYAATLTNLSTGGCALLAKSPLGRKDEPISVRFRLYVNETEQYLYLSGVIRNVHGEAVEEGSTPMVQHGIQFTEVAPNDNMVLTAYVYQKLFEEAAEA